MNKYRTHNCSELSENEIKNNIVKLTTSYNNNTLIHNVYGYC